MNPRYVLVVVGPGASGHGRLRLLATTAAGRRVREIGPRHVRHLYPDRLFALDRRHIWLDAFSGGGGSERLYRTVDGGRTWRSRTIFGHVLAAGSADDLDFVTASDGWLAVEEPTGPDDDLYRTTDAGSTWHRVAQLHPGRRRAGLPEVGDIRFDTGTGWLGGNTSYALYTTTDGGLRWRRAPIPGPRRSHDGLPSRYGLPSAFGSTVLEPVTKCVHRPSVLHIYRQDEAGGRWVQTSRWRQPGQEFSCRQISVALPSPTVGWAIAVEHKKPVVGRMIDGRHWTRVADPAPSARFASIYATDATQAFVLADGRIYVTADGGRSWRVVRVG